MTGILLLTIYVKINVRLLKIRVCFLNVRVCFLKQENGSSFFEYENIS